MNWILSHWDSISVAALAVIGAASVIVKMTPTPRDDAVVAWLYKAVEFISLAKKKPDAPPTV